MRDDLTAAVQAELAKAKVSIAIFYEGEFANGFLRLWSGVGNIDWNGHTWTGAGHLMGITAVQETTDISARGITCSLSGMPLIAGSGSPPESMLAIVLTNARQGLDGSVWLGFFDAAGALIVDPARVFKGRLDVPTIDEGGETCTISITYESRLIDLERPRLRRYTTEDQQIDYPADKGFEFVPALQDAVINWGIPGAPQVKLG